MQRILKAVKRCLCVYINISIDIHASVNYMRVIPSVNQITCNCNFHYCDDEWQSRQLVTIDVHVH